MKIETHPVQVIALNNRTVNPAIRKEVTLRAYEVHKAIYSEHKLLITGNCRGGFSTGELICFLYAHTFPEAEWRYRFNEAMEGMVNL